MDKDNMKEVMKKALLGLKISILIEPMDETDIEDPPDEKPSPMAEAIKKSIKPKSKVKRVKRVIE